MVMTNKINTLVYENDKFTENEDEIVSDETVVLVINKSLSRNFSISPNSLKEFSIGYMLGEGLINSIENVESIKIKGNNIKANINLKDSYMEKELIVGSDCFGGWRRKIDFIDKVESDFTIDPKVLLKNTEKIREKAITWKNTGGTHIASFINEEKNEFISIEDISRHVAIDKVIGAAALKKLDFKNSYIIYSGRMPADILIKIARVGIPLIASNAAPTFSGYSVADKANITMVGFIRDNRFNIYTHPRRVISK